MTLVFDAVGDGLVVGCNLVSRHPEGCNYKVCTPLHGGNGYDNC